MKQNKYITDTSSVLLTKNRCGAYFCNCKKRSVKSNVLTKKKYKRAYAWSAMTKGPNRWCASSWHRKTELNLANSHCVYHGRKETAGEGCERWAWKPQKTVVYWRHFLQRRKQIRSQFFLVLHKVLKKFLTNKSFRSHAFRLQILKYFYVLNSLLTTTFWFFAATDLSRPHEPCQVRMEHSFAVHDGMLVKVPDFPRVYLYKTLRLDEPQIKAIKCRIFA